MKDKDREIKRREAWGRKGMERNINTSHNGRCRAEQDDCEASNGGE